MNSNLREIITKPEEDGKRQIWIDLAKGICIILVIFNHVAGDAFNITFLQQIRMPLYFILSGLFFKDYGGFLIFLKKKTNNILVPFIFFYAISITLYSFYQTTIYKSFQYPDFAIILKERFFFNNAIWFLLCLFNVNILYYLTQSITVSNILRITLIILLGFCGWLLSKQNIILPLYIDSSLTALPFFYIGSRIRNTSLLTQNKLPLWYSVLASLFIIILLIIPYYIGSHYIRFVNNSIMGDVIIAGLCSTLGTVSLLIICKYIKWIPIISYAGRYSIIILCVHMLFIKVFSYASNASSRVLIEFILVALFSILSIPLCKKYIPFFVAQKPLIK